jgi:hypothetical protein
MSNDEGNDERWASFLTLAHLSAAALAKADAPALARAPANALALASRRPKVERVVFTVLAEECGSATWYVFPLPFSVVLTKDELAKAGAPYFEAGNDNTTL